ncbi:MAG: DEAD/DEAH box helicase family protein [Gammaproteobacteria bacterium]|nr:DEAD/DEAH box helicase family protein [Gammaproteobacteria bacterium]
MISEFKLIDNLSCKDFEIFVRDVFVAAGWSDAVITSVGKEFSHGDGGVDIFAYKNKRKFAIEVKQRQLGSTVDVSALNQLVTGAKLANVTNMILVTNSYFTSEVRVRALRLGVELIDRDALQNLWVEKHSEIGREIKPRIYQETVIKECVSKINSGKNKLLIEMATGLGKTYTAAHLVRRILQDNRNYRILFLAHQVEILLQSVTSFKNVFGIGTYSFSACFDGSMPENTDFVFGSFDTLYAKISALNSNMFDIIVVDEAHHVPARTYSTVISYFSPRYLIGLTATPYREDDKNVLNFFGGKDGHVGKYDLAWALRHNKLAYPKYLVLLDDLDQSKIDQLKKGLSITDLDKHLFLHKKDEEVVKIIEDTICKKKIINPKGIVFCRSISHMKYLIQFFPPGSATLVHSKMSDQQRRQNIRDFREFEHRYILVCDLFNEGIDIPETNILIFMRYTGSQTVWLQQLGRGLRKTPNKDYVYVLDFVGSLERLSEVKRLKKIIDDTPLEINNLDSVSRADDLSVIHDSSLDVLYNQSAAQVLKLIDELKYRLNSREQAINKLREYYLVNMEIPRFEELQSQLEDISMDQIATHFDSYMGYFQSAFPEVSLPDYFHRTCEDYVRSYNKHHSILPSSKAISMASKVNNLLLYSESEVDFLLEGINPQKTVISNPHQDEPSGIFNCTNDVNKQNERESMIMEKYLDFIFNSHDLKNLQEEKREEIRNVFNSEFFFLKSLREYRELKNGKS